ncbi:hypothetical protein WICMUC_000317 [Wickerhamomyces mucosus]|uniref:Thiol-specific monooxygenase n=1 Tax=Wickerhamomyces mucosus TaxID=1378264 RepID=A0A9P8TIT8_9ASCO|nr:hypothetical protein WICMUC_000317 [Wickerhamomyces mucosus]
MSNIKSIAVIGAGPCGAGLTKALVSEHAFERIKVFERRPKFGGLWNYTRFKSNSDVKRDIPSINPHSKIDKIEAKGELFYESPVYKYLDANVPKTLMAYNNYPFPENVPLFPKHEQILEYIENYSKDIEQYVSFNEEVTSLEFDSTTKKWKILSQNLNDKLEISEEFDAVAIAIGSYDKPFIPDVEGVKEWNEKYPGSIIHAKSYDEPSQFKDSRNILVVGNSASGADIAFQLATTLNRIIYKSIRSENAMPAGKDDRITDVGDLLRFEPETKTVYFKDGQSLTDVDSIIFATGYLKSIPFIKNEKLITDGAKVHGLYRHLVYYHNPTLAVIGVPRFVLPTRLSETQGCWLSKLWSGRLSLPSFEEMESYNHGLEGDERQHHDLKYPKDVDYSNILNEEAKKVKGEYGHFAVHWDEEQRRVRSNIKYIKEGYIKYQKETGKLAQNLEELENGGYIDYPKEIN